MKHREFNFEEEIVKDLLNNRGWVEGISAEYDKELGLYTKDLIEFIKTSEPKAYEKIKKREKREDEMLKWLKNIFLNTGETLKELQNKIDEQSQKIVELEKKVTKMEGENKQLLDSIELKDKEITKQEKKIDKISQNIANAYQEMQEAQRNEIKLQNAYFQLLVMVQDFYQLLKLYQKRCYLF